MTKTLNNQEVLQLLRNTPNGPEVVDTFVSHYPGFYVTHIISLNVTKPTRPVDRLWHLRLGHPGQTMLHRILHHTMGIPIHPLLFHALFVECIIIPTINVGFPNTSGICTRHL